MQHARMVWSKILLWTPCNIILYYISIALKLHWAAVAAQQLQTAIVLTVKRTSREIVTVFIVHNDARHSTSYKWKSAYSWYVKSSYNQPVKKLNVLSTTCKKNSPRTMRKRRRLEKKNRFENQTNE